MGLLITVKITIIIRVYTFCLEITCWQVHMYIFVYLKANHNNLHSAIRLDLLKLAKILFIHV